MVIGSREQILHVFLLLFHILAQTVQRLQIAPCMRARGDRYWFVYSRVCFWNFSNQLPTFQNWKISHQNSHFWFLEKPVYLAILSEHSAKLSYLELSATCPLYRRHVFFCLPLSPWLFHSLVTCLAPVGFCIYSSYGRHSINELRTEILHSVNTARQPFVPILMGNMFVLSSYNQKSYFSH